MKTFLTYVFPIHVVEEAEAVGRGVGDTVGVFRCYIEKRAHKPGLFTLLPWSRCLNVHVEPWKNRSTEYLKSFHHCPHLNWLKSLWTHWNQFFCVNTIWYIFIIYTIEKERFTFQLWPFGRMVKRIKPPTWTTSQHRVHNISTISTTALLLLHAASFSVLLEEVSAITGGPLGARSMTPTSGPPD